MKITLCDKEFTVSPLTLNQIRALDPDLKSMNKWVDEKRMIQGDEADAVLRIVQTSLQKAHPDVSVDEIGDLIDITNFNVVLRAVFDVSGFQQQGNATAR